MAAKQMFAHEPFNCLVCRQWIGALEHEASVGSTADPNEESESYTVCEGCGAVYLIMTRLHEVRDIAKLSPQLTWKLVPDALTPGEVKNVQARIRSRMFRADRGQA